MQNFLFSAMLVSAWPALKHGRSAEPAEAVLKHGRSEELAELVLMTLAVWQGGTATHYHH